MSINAQKTPLVLLGLDGGDYRFIERWTREGYLPTIASIMQRGCWAKTTGSEHIAEHGTALSLLSGISRSQHGYYYFRQLQPRTYDLKAFNARKANTLPFWSHLRGRGKKVATIDAPDSELVTGLPGIQLANWAFHEAAMSISPPCSEPAELLQDVRKIYGQQISVSEFDLNSNFNKDREMYQRFLKRIEKKGALCRELLTRECFDLIAAGFYESHTAGHRFWKYRPEAETRESELTHAIRNVYQAIDREMGLLLAELPEDANVFIISCFGLEDQYPTTGLIQTFCRQLGYQAAPETVPPSLTPLSLARRLVPESWRTALSNNLPLRVQERLLADQFRNSTNWEKTTAFAIPSLYTSFLRVNFKGREPQGIVEPGEEYKAVLDRLEDDLKQLIDPVTGKAAVLQITRTVDLFDCDPPESLPDLFVEWQPARHFMQRVIHPKAELVQQKIGYHRDSYHSFTGFVAAAGPSIQGRGAIADISLLDLAPTFLSLMGEPIPEGMTGKPIEALSIAAGVNK